MKRIICFLRDHRWVRRQYPNDESGAGYFLHCLRCGRDDHHTQQLLGNSTFKIVGGSGFI